MSEHQPPEQPNEPREAGEREPQPVRPKIWIGSLADYNAGRLHGDWVDADVDDETLLESTKAILATSQEPDAEEWGIFDYDGFGSFKVGEYEDLAVVARVARGIIEHGPAFAAWADVHDAEPDMLDHFEDAFSGAYESREAWADSLLEDFDLDTILDGTMPTWLQHYVTIDRAGLVRDLELGGDYWIEDNPAGGIWVFDARG